MEEKKIHVVYPDERKWEKEVSKLGKPMKCAPLINDDDTGMLVKYAVYFAGTVTPEHTHHCAHGMYVVSGTLHTSFGDYGPGSFVWFPEGIAAFHGAGEKEDAECVFITNKPFDIIYENPEFNEG